MGALHLGILSVYLSDPVVSGYTTGAAVMVFTSQINEVFGVHKSRASGPGKLFFVRNFYFVPISFLYKVPIHYNVSIHRNI